MHRARSSLSITISVWQALFLREAVVRLSTSRVAWIWLLLNPMLKIVLLMFLFAAIRMRVVGGMDTAVWVLSGLLAFSMFRVTGIQTMNAIHPNKALFNYRQVKPVDTIFVRAVLEGFLMILVSLILCSITALFGLDVVPDDMLLVLNSFFCLWLLGVGFGLFVSVGIELLSGVKEVIQMIMMPLYLLSGVIFPINSIPPPYREWALLNPLVHCVDAVRLGFSSQYIAINELDLGYSYACAITFIFLWLALQIRY
jgi:capsular polysaccharide transport system permease protein